MSLSSEDILKLESFFKKSFANHKTQHQKGFQNFMGTQTNPNAFVVDVKNRKALQELMCEIQALNRNKNPQDRILIRAAAGGNEGQYSASYSATDVTNADIVVRLVGNEFKSIEPIKNTNRVRVGASIQIGELDTKLYEQHKLVLPSSSLIPYVTAAGLAAAGGHGTGKDQPSFAGLVTRATFCLENGEIVSIDKTNPDFATIMGANNGLFGMMLDMDIECMPAQKLSCVMEKRSVCEFMEEVEAGLFQHDPYVSVMYVPTYLPDEMTNRLVNNVIIYRFRPAPLDTKDVNNDKCFSDLSQALQIKMGDAVNIPTILRRYPSLIPHYLRHITAPLAIGDKDELAVGRWDQLMHYRTAYPTDLDEICGIFPVMDQPANQPQGQEIVKALKHAIQLMDEHAKRGEYPITYGLYFRFIQGTNGGLSFTSHPNNHHVCAMDLTTNENIPGFAEFKAKMQDFFLNEMHGKFHWGKNAPLNIDYATYYGEDLKKMQEALETWHHIHHIATTRSALINPLFSRVFGYPEPTVTRAPVARATLLSSSADSLKIAGDAGKLLDMVGTPDDECRLLKARIQADQKKMAGQPHTFFAEAPAATKEKTKKQSKRCVIL